MTGFGLFAVFGARVNAANPIHAIERRVRHAHRYHARVFVTLNTILRDDELEPARRLVQQLYDIGVDALIVQDVGLLELDLPPIQLHASTQYDIRTPQKARFLRDVGFSQMVLARELMLEQIAAVDAALGPRDAPGRAIAAPTEGTARRPAAYPTRCATHRGVSWRATNMCCP